ncbi:MAG TPA: MMPL family transporter [Polyangiaceae bacterium]
MNPASPRVRAFVRWTLTNGRLLWILALLLAIPATWRTAQLYVNLHSDFEELLPKEAPSVIALDELRARTPGLSHLGIVVDVGDPANLPAGERFLDELAARVRTYPPEMVAAVRLGTHEERAFLEQNAPLYVSKEDLAIVRQRVEARRDWEVAAGTGNLIDDSAPPSLDFSDLEAKYEQRGANKMPHGRFSSAEQHLTLMLVEVGSAGAGAGPSKRLLQRVRADVKALGGTDAYAKGMRMGYAADAATAVEETEALMTDLSVSSIFVLFGVGVVIVLYFRWLRSLFVLIPPLLLATVYAFGIASLPPLNVTVLNSNTAFLASIIVGNGINFGIVLLARYVEERRRGVAMTHAMETAVGGAGPGTLAAALAAGAAYAALSFTQFQGFRQFGMVGGVGMVLSWVVAFVLVPPLALRLDAGKLGPLVKEPPRIMPTVVALADRFRVPVVAVALALTLGAAWKARTFDSGELETDISKLRRADTWTQGEGYWGARMNDLLGEYLTPLAILTDSPEEARLVEARLGAAKDDPDLGGMIAHVRTLDDVVPTDQPAKIAEIAAIRDDLTPHIRALLTDEQRKGVDRFLGGDGLRPFAATDVPSTLTTGFRERDGRIDGRTVLVYPQLSAALWEGHALGRFVGALRTLATDATKAQGGRPPRVAGSLPLTSDILTSVEHDGPRVTLLAFLGVVLVVFALFRFRRTSFYVLGSLIVGVLWLLGATMVLGVKINFANFIAFPITFGIGVDYAVNVMSRYDQDGDILGAVKHTGGAVSLCSLTTILGYSSLLLAENRALYLFGLFAVLGEIACLTTAVVVLPALLRTIQHAAIKRRAPGHSAGE